MSQSAGKEFIRAAGRQSVFPWKFSECFKLLANVLLSEFEKRKMRKSTGECKGLLASVLRASLPSRSPKETLIVSSFLHITARQQPFQNLNHDSCGFSLYIYLYTE